MSEREEPNSTFVPGSVDKVDVLSLTRVHTLSFMGENSLSAVLAVVALFSELQRVSVSHFRVLPVRSRHLIAKARERGDRGESKEGGLINAYMRKRRKLG